MCKIFPCRVCAGEYVLNNAGQCFSEKTVVTLVFKLKRQVNFWYTGTTVNFCKCLTSIVILHYAIKATLPASCNWWTYSTHRLSSKRVYTGTVNYDPHRFCYLK